MAKQRGKPTRRPNTRAAKSTKKLGAKKEGVASPTLEGESDIVTLEDVAKALEGLRVVLDLFEGPQGSDAAHLNAVARIVAGVNAEIATFDLDQEIPMARASLNGFGSQGSGLCKPSA